MPHLGSAASGAAPFVLQGTPKPPDRPWRGQVGLPRAAPVPQLLTPSRPRPQRALSGLHSSLLSQQTGISPPRQHLRLLPTPYTSLRCCSSLLCCGHHFVAPQKGDRVSSRFSLVGDSLLGTGLRPCAQQRWVSKTLTLVSPWDSLGNGMPMGGASQVGAPESSRLSHRR